MSCAVQIKYVGVLKRGQGNAWLDEAANTRVFRDLFAYVQGSPPPFIAELNSLGTPSVSDHLMWYLWVRCRNGTTPDFGMVNQYSFYGL